MDVYDPCPCGSGKKLKFCCNPILEHMERVFRLQDNNQPQMALQLLQAIEKHYPDNPWVLTTQATILFNHRQSRPAKAILQRLLSKQSDHAMGIVIYALASFSADGFEAAQPAIYRALQRCSASFPRLVSGLAVGIAANMESRRRFMAVRQYLALAMRLAREQEQQQIFSSLLRIDGHAQIPYPLRGTHELASYSGPEEFQKDARKAFRLATFGCWAPAARIFAKLAESDPESAALWQNMGLCRAWSGDETGAAAALHRAACFHQNFNQAVECETIAQLLDLNVTDDRYRMVYSRFRVGSVAKLLSKLDEAARIVRVPLADPDADASDGQNRPVAVYQILDRAPGEFAVDAEPSLDVVSRVIGHVNVFAQQNGADKPAKALVIGREGDGQEAAVEQFRQAAGDDISEDALGPDEQRVLNSRPREWSRLETDWYFSPKTPAIVMKRYEQFHWHRFVNEIWPETPLAGLDRRTPLQAAGDPEFKLRLTAAVYVLDAHAASFRKRLDVGAVCQRLRIEPLRIADLNEQTQLNTFSIMQLHLVPVEQLTDRQLKLAMNRILLTHHVDFVDRVLREVLSRPLVASEVDLDRGYASLAAICQAELRHAEALNYVSQAYAAVTEGADKFERKLRWKLYELTIRLENPNDSEVPSLFRHLWDYYGHKLPGIREDLAKLAQLYDLPIPRISEAEIVTAGGTAESAPRPGVWLPGAVETVEKKLWLPGQT